MLGKRISCTTLVQAAFMLAAFLLLWWGWAGIAAAAPPWMRLVSLERVEA